MLKLEEDLRSTGGGGYVSGVEVFEGVDVGRWEGRGKHLAYFSGRGEELVPLLRPYLLVGCDVIVQYLARQGTEEWRLEPGC